MLGRLGLKRGDVPGSARSQYHAQDCHRATAFLLLLCALFWAIPGYAKTFNRVVDVPHGPVVIFPKTSLGPRDLAIIVNDDDPRSVRIGHYYEMRRGIPARNVIHVRFAPGNSIMSRAVFRQIDKRVKARTPPGVQAYALTWTLPYRVGCMSITTAFAMGYNPHFCGGVCTLTKRDPYFNSNSVAPYRDFGIRPTMMLAGKDFRAVKALIDRGVASDGTDPRGTAYLVSTDQATRNVRAVEYGPLARFMHGIFRTDIIHANFIQDERDVLFYFTGMARVSKLKTNHVLPGAIGDDLTSAGGILSGPNDQTTVLQWLHAGVTGSYGTVVEPCNFRTKFPDPAILMSRYTNGESLIEAYWKSVAMPGQGIFVGEPLANPFGGYSITYQSETLTIRTHALLPGRYVLLAADSRSGPYSPVGKRAIGRDLQRITLKNAGARFYRLVRKTSIPEHTSVAHVMHGQ